PIGHDLVVDVFKGSIPCDDPALFILSGSRSSPKPFVGTIDNVQTISHICFFDIVSFDHVSPNRTHVGAITRISGMSLPETDSLRSRNSNELLPKWCNLSDSSIGTCDPRDLRSQIHE